MYQKDLQISKGTGSQAVGLTNPHAPAWEDGKSSEQRKKLVKSMKKELGLQPYGEIPSYSETILPKEVGDKLNAREKESLDLQWAILQAPLLKLRFGFKIVSL